MYLLIVAVSAVIPLFGIPLGILGLYGDKKHQMLYICCIALGFASLAYGYQARAETDMVRYWQIVENYAQRHLSLRDVFTEGSYGANSTENLWFINIVFWLASRIKDPRIIPAISTFCVYYYTLSITITICSDTGIPRRQMIFYILFSITALNFFSIANNVRNVLAFMMISYATFRDIWLHKRNAGTLLLYILPIFIHTSAVIFLIMRLMIKPASRLKAVALAAVVLIYPILEVLNTFAHRMTGFWSIFGSAIMKAYRYFNGISWTEWGIEMQASGSEKVLKYIYISIMLILGILWIVSEKEKGHSVLYSQRNITTDLYLMNNYAFYVCLMAIACVPMITPEYWRFSATAIGIGGGIFARTRQKEIHNRYYDLAWIALIGLGLIGMVLWVRSLKMYALFLPTIFQALESSPLLVLIKDSINLIG